jgi:hypothetical protein
MRLHSEEQVCPRRWSLQTAEGALSCGQPEQGGKGFWNAEQREDDPTSCWDSCVASEPLLPTEAIMRPLCARERHRCDGWGGWESRLSLDLQILAVQVQAGPPMQPPAPITPEHRSRAHSQRMQQHTDLSWLLGGAALPLALLTQ